MTIALCSWTVSRDEVFKECNCRQPATREVDGRSWCDFHAQAVQRLPDTVDGEILGRVSTKEQADHGYSMPTQVEESVRYAIRNRIRVVPERVFIEDVSGMTPIASRPQGQKALALLDQKTVRAVIGHRVDRYSRDIVDLLGTVRKITRGGAQFHAVDVGRVKNELDVVLVIKGWAGGDEHARINEKMSAGRYKKAELGKVVGSSEAPYGYQYLRDERHKVVGLEIYEPEARIVRLIFEWCVRGEDGRHPMTLGQIARRLTADGVLPPAQSRGHTQVGRSHIRLGVWNDGSVGRIVRNSTYRGVWHYGKTNAHGQPRPVADRKAVPVVPLVDPDTWKRAQFQLNSNRDYAKRNAKRDYVLRGLARCRCQRKMGGVTRYFGKYTYHYYICPAHREWTGLCDQPQVVADNVEAFVWSQVGGFFESGRLFELALRQAQKAEARSAQLPLDELQVVEEQLAVCEKEARNCALALKRAGEGIVARQLEAERDVINRQYEELAARRHALLEVASARQLTDEAVEDLLQFRADAECGLQNATNEDKRRFYERIGLTVHIDGQTAQVKCRIRRSSRAGENPIVTRASKGRSRY